MSVLSGVWSTYVLAPTYNQVLPPGGISLAGGGVSVAVVKCFNGNPVLSWELHPYSEVKLVWNPGFGESPPYILAQASRCACSWRLGAVNGAPPPSLGGGAESGGGDDGGGAEEDGWLEGGGLAVTWHELELQEPWLVGLDESVW